MRGGRYQTGALAEAYPQACADRGLLPPLDPADAFGIFYGLLVQDTHIRVLLGEDPPSEAEIAQRARDAVRRFLVVLGSATS